MEKGAILDAVRAQKRSGVRRVASDALFVTAGVSVGLEIISLFRGQAKKFAKIAFGVALAGEAVAYAYDRIHKPTPEQLIAATYHNTQAVLDSATYGTDVILDPEQNPVSPGPLDTRFPYHAIKRGFDVAFSSAVVALGAVPTALMCAAISVDTPGAPIFFNDRVGRYGLPLRIFKLRTIIEDAEDLDQYLPEAQRRHWPADPQVAGDPRVTSVARFCSCTSIDELPPFFNVFLG